MKADPTETLAVLREVREHAGEGALPVGMCMGPRQVYLAGQFFPCVMVRDLCVGYWLRRLFDARSWTDLANVCHTDADLFTSISKYILALPADMARRVFARKNGG